METILKTKAEQRLEQLEALKRPLTRQESAELRRCLHAIYMRNWRIERALFGTGGDLVDVARTAIHEIEAIAKRMDEAEDEGWPLPKAEADWQDHARAASAQLRDAILRAQGKLEALAA